MSRQYHCHFCGLCFSLGSKRFPGREDYGLICVQCGTQHRLRAAGACWIIFRAGPEREKREGDPALYLQTLADVAAASKKWHEEHAPELAAEEALRAAYREEQRVALGERRVAYREASAAGNIPPLRIDLNPSRRRPKPPRPTKKLNWSEVKEGLLLILMIPLFIPYFLWEVCKGVTLAVKKRLPYYKRREAQRRLAWIKMWHERWRIVPLKALTDQGPIDWVHQDIWFQGVSCGRCGAVGSLQSRWHSSQCPLCRNEPIEDLTEWVMGEVSLSQ